MIEIEEIIAPQYWQVELTEVKVVENVVVFEAYFTVKLRNCPDCGFSSSRIHSRYQRQLADLPLAVLPQI
jgi:hypothetical protein